MSDNFELIQGGICAPLGFTANGIHCGIRHNKEKPDLAMIMCDTKCTAAGVFTQNLACGAPVTVTKQHIKDGYARAVVCNSGIANTCNPDGIEKAEAMCKAAAEATGLSPDDFIVASTGVIGMPLHMEPIINGMQTLADGLSEFGSEKAAQAIMTTDTVRKEVACEFTVSGHACRMGGISKGSGMIHPNMATMLSFITTDAAVSPQMLKKALSYAVKDSFNMLSVDGDTSTNDTLCILASGKSGAPEINAPGPEFDNFCSVLRSLCIGLARRMAKDGEGASKLVECYIRGADSDEHARKVAKAVICSNLVKAAMFGADANWGRVICAIGYCGVPLDINSVCISFVSRAGSILVCKDGRAVVFSEPDAKAILSEDEITIDCSIGTGEYSSTAFGCDLTYDYVKINGDYRT